MKVVSMERIYDIPEELRSIADQIESGEIEGDDCTVVIDREVFHLSSQSPELSVCQAVFNMSLGINKLTSAGLYDVD